MNLEKDFSIFRNMDLEELMARAWQVRKNNFPRQMGFATPGPKVFITDSHQNDTKTFQAASITGEKCSLMCDHCKGELLKSMKAVPAGRDLEELGRKMKSAGGRGLLVSGGADIHGRVPFSDGHLEAIKRIKDMGLKVIIHTGILDRYTAEKIKESGVDLVLLDMIGSRETIRDVYHLKYDVVDYVNALGIIKETKLKMAPHIIIGHHFGRIQGEYRALLELLRQRPEVLVFVVINPIIGTPMEKIQIPQMDDIARLISMTRIMAPETKITLGCGKPPGESRKDIEKTAFLSGVNVIAYPLDETVGFIRNKGFGFYFDDVCCCLF